jgi:hypothetical protein
MSTGGLVQICEDLTNFGTLLQQEKPWTGSTVRWIGGALGVVGPRRLAAREHYGGSGALQRW